MATIFHFEERPSGSPFVEVVWRNTSEGGGPFISMATSRWQIVVTRVGDRTTLAVRGPETKATPAWCPPGAEHFGIYFRPGVVLNAAARGLVVSSLTDGMLELPAARADAFWLDGQAWQFPGYENADTFVDRLARSGLLAWEPVVAEALRAERPALSVRSVQRRFLRATGLTHGAFHQIDRARQAVRLLQGGASILDVVDQAGYADQPHLTRALKRLAGLTPAQLARGRAPEQLSFLSHLRP